MRETDPPTAAIRKLGRNLEEQGQLPASRFSKRALRFFEEVLASGVVERAPSPAGRGWVIRVERPDRFSAFLRARIPEDEGVANRDRIDTPRARGILQAGDSKSAGRRLDFLHLSLRAVRPCAFTRNGTPLDLYRTTLEAGCADILFRDGDVTECRGAIALVENAELWAHFERLEGVEVPLVCFYSGVVSWRVLKWLRSPGMGDAAVVHFADYDPVGLREFRKVRRLLGDRVSLFVPENLRRYFELGLTTRRILQRAPNRKTFADLLDEPEPVRGVVDLILEFGSVVEQEALLLELR